MNISDLENHLRHAPETRVSVSSHQHDDIMRAVKLAAPANKKASSSWRRPAWGMALAASLVLVVFVAQSPRETVSTPEIELAPKPIFTLSGLSEKLKTIPAETTISEKELELEIQRLKNDLERFGLKT
jgi:hypothetical protein